MKALKGGLVSNRKQQGGLVSNSHMKVVGRFNSKQFTLYKSQMIINYLAGAALAQPPVQQIMTSALPLGKTLD